MADKSIKWKLFPNMALFSDLQTQERVHYQIQTIEFEHWASHYFWCLQIESTNFNRLAPHDSKPKKRCTSRYTFSVESQHS